jgi:ribosomal protein L37AE/L43A
MRGERCERCGTSIEVKDLHIGIILCEECWEKVTEEGD